MADDVVVDLLMRVKGDAEIRDLKKAIAELTTELEAAVLEQKSLDDAMKNPAIREATAALKATEDELGRLNASRKQAAEAARAEAQAAEAVRHAEAQAAEAVTQAAEAVRRAEAAYGSLARSTTDAAVQTQQHAMAASRQTAESYDALARNTKKAASESSYALMQLGNTLDDMQYIPAQGLRPIINNVMQIAPQVGIAMIAVDALAKALRNLPELFKGSGLGEFAGDVEKLKARVEDLNGSWLKTQTVVRETKQAMADLRDAQEADKVRAEAGATTNVPAGAFAAGIKATSGGRAAAIVNQMVQERVAAAPSDAVRQAIQSGAITQEMLRNTGLNERSSLADVARVMQDDPAYAATLRGAVVRQRTNAMLSQLRGGDEGAFQALYNYIEGNERLGQRGGDDKLKDPFARAMEESYEQNDPDMAAMRAAGASGRQVAGKMEPSIKAQRAKRREVVKEFVQRGFAERVKEALETRVGPWLRRKAQEREQTEEQKAAEAGLRDTMGQLAAKARPGRMPGRARTRAQQRVVGRRQKAKMKAETALVPLEPLAPGARAESLPPGAAMRITPEPGAGPPLGRAPARPRSATTDEQLRRGAVRMGMAVRRPARRGRPRRAGPPAVRAELMGAAPEVDPETARRAREILSNPSLRAEVERQFAAGGTAATIGPQAGQFLEQQGLVMPAQAARVGVAVAGQVKADLNRRQAGYVAEGMDKIEAFARVQGEILAEFARMDQRLMQMDQSLMRQQGIMQGHRQTRLNRGEGF